MEGTIGEIRGFAGNFVPRNWAFCQGQLLAISSNEALFSLIGTYYGGDGRTSFGLPDLRGRTIIGTGNGPGLTDRRIGQKLGINNTTLSVINLPSHTHPTTSTATGSGSLSGQVKIPASTGTDTTKFTDSPKDAFLRETEIYSSTATAGSYLGGDMENDLAIDLSSFHVNVQVGLTGENRSYDSNQPLLATNYIVCMYGIFPSRN